MNTELIEMALCADAAYAPHAASLLASVLAAHRSRATLRIWLITDDPGAVVWAKVRAVVEDGGALWKSVHCASQSLPQPPEAAVNPRKIKLTRLRLAELLPPDLERIIYLDSDIIVRRDLAELWNTPLSDSELLAAVRNAGGNCLEEHGVDPALGYFNSGVLLINLQQWRAAKLGQAMLQCFAQPPGPLTYLDQDALNVVVAGRWKRLDWRWNFQNEHLLLGRAAFGLSSAGWRALCDDPFIVHFTGPTKPWHYWDDHPFRGEYFRHREQGGFGRDRPGPAGPSDHLRRVARGLTPRRWRRTLHTLLPALPVRSAVVDNR